jgi:hypothetical protein
MTDTLTCPCIEQRDTQPPAAFAFQPLQFVNKPLFQYRTRTGTACATQDDEAGQTRARRVQQTSSADHMFIFLCTKVPKAAA